MDDLTSQLINDNQTLWHLGAAMLLGALIGLERGWSKRKEEAGSRIAGIRTHALVGLLGGLAALLSETLTSWAFPTLLLATTAIALVAWRTRAESVRNVSITDSVGLLIVFCLGAIALAVDLVIATAVAVVTAMILDNREEIHGLLHKLEARELDAAFKLLLITVVMLPILPNQGFGPGGVLNPYEIWWMVVLIASISFVGYFAIRMGGAEKGILFTSLFAGLSSSTALTLHFSRQSRVTGELSPLLAVGILIACGTMFPRVLLVATMIHPPMFTGLLLPVLVMSLLIYVPAFFMWRRARRGSDIEQPELKQNPLDLTSALLFGLLLTIIMLAGEWLQGWLGDAGIYLLAASSGVADVDAINLSLTRMAEESITVQTAVVGIIIASAANNLVKTGMAVVIGTRTLGLWVAGPMIVSLAAGLVTAWLV
ncbi:MgtC/SapB family protein [Guyparkeria halophila]|uniref:MgtC/SapB family protein n=1 Tax=Guyparkeria halophila TaxID=47960 RepID=A0ABZ0YV68_9GAMM|nr:MgtC/SapB family protein [Guyparkeria halophila]WQH15921.1 MgtC/SapB family protein [Guyparkeria halophila]